MDELITNLLKITKQSLSIIETSTYKDEEIKMLIRAGIKDIERLGLAVEDIEEDNALFHSAVVLYVKSRFGNVDIKEKIQSEKVYRQMVSEITLSRKGILKVEKLKELESTEKPERIEEDVRS